MISHQEFKKEVERWAEEIDVEFKEIQFREMKKKWASCSSRGRLTFNEDLLSESKKVRDEVIVHELLHLRYPNHGKIFSLLLNTYLGKTLVQMIAKRLKTAQRQTKNCRNNL
ncbi:MAG TPA: M48 family metallopeptidase [Candidatus Marinimicrobia bacterium]|nr:M48 family metallopeptidase [Candidatus Neomarinimicrobiota bacterium]